MSPVITTLGGASGASQASVDRVLGDRAHQYVVYQDAGSVWLRDKTRDTLTLYADWTLALQAVINDASFLAYGAHVLVSASGGFLPAPGVGSRPLLLPAAMQADFHIEGESLWSSGFKLSGYTPRFMDPNKTADYQVFGHVFLENFTIDGNNVTKLSAGYGSNSGGAPNTGVDSVVLGTKQWSTTMSRVQFQHLRFKRLRTINNPHDKQKTNSHRLIFWLQPTETDGNLTPIIHKNIVFDDVQVDGNFGAAVGITMFPSGVQPNDGVPAGYTDDVHFHKFRWETDDYNVDVGAYPTGGIELGGQGYVRNGTIDEGSYVRGANDDGIAIENVTGTFTVRDTECINCHTNCFEFAQFLVHPNAAKAWLVFDNVRAGRTSDYTDGLNATNQLCTGFLYDGWAPNQGGVNKAVVGPNVRISGTYVDEANDLGKTGQVIIFPSPTNVTDAVMTSGSAVLTTLGSTPFFASAVGQPVRVTNGAGSGVDLVTTVLSYQNSGQVTLARTASNSVSGVLALVGTLNALNSLDVDLKYSKPNLSHTTGTAKTIVPVSLCFDPGATIKKLRVKIDAEVAGTQTGGGSDLAFWLVNVFGGKLWDEEYDLTLDFAVTGMTNNRVRHLYLGSSGLAPLTTHRGKTRVSLKTRGITSDTTPRGAYIRGQSLQSFDELVMERDTSLFGAPSGMLAVEFVSGGNDGTTNAGLLTLAPGGRYPGGLRSRNGGVFTSTPGAVSTLTIAHGCFVPSGVTPRSIIVVPADANGRAAPDKYETSDATNITLNFVNPLDAARSYSWRWWFEV